MLEHIKRKYLIRPLQNLCLRLRLLFRTTSSHIRTNKPLLTSGKGLKKCDIFYINLDHRDDRRKQIESELVKLDIDHAVRFSAKKNKNGALGCSLSHFSVLNSRKQQTGRLIMVCEDDCEFIANREVVDRIIDKFDSDKRLDVLCLAYNAFNGVKVDDTFSITSDTQTTACYVLKPNVVEPFLKVAKLSISLLEKGKSSDVAAIDMVWKKIQKQFLFAIPNQKIAKQRISFSDIEKEIVDYN